MNTLFDSLQEKADSEGPLPAVDMLVDHFRSTSQFNELFEALKIQNRLRHGFSAVARDNDPPLSIQQSELLERGLIDACREVGVALLKQGNLQDGWMYMRAVGDQKAAREALAGHAITSENLDAYLSIFIQEGVDIQRGVELTLEHRGTCNTITMLESVIAMRDRKDQQAGVGPLVRHMHAELLVSIRADMERRKLPNVQTESSSSIGPIAAMLKAYPALLDDGTYHLDTSHVASTVRFARVLDNRDDLILALDLSRYGRQLHTQYHYASEEPFQDLYLMSSYFFSVLLGENVEACLKPFLQKAESLDINEHGSIGIETYVDLLSRIGRHEEALQFLLKRMPRGMRPFGVAPSLLELSSLSRNFQPMLQQSQQRDDLLGFAAALLQSKSI
jgi:hypothetical protein